MIIYLIESIREHDIVYKIGHTKNSKNRISNLQTGNDGTLNILYEFHSKYGSKLEKRLHKFYSHNNIKNEWFKLNSSEIENFNKICENIEKGFDALKDNPFFNKSI